MGSYAQAALIAGGLLAGAAVVASGLGGNRIDARADQTDARGLAPGGAATSKGSVDNRNAFSHASATLSFAREFDFKIGNAIFRKLWVSSPASTRSSDGLGPLFNARSCQRCHLKDGRGHPPAAPWPKDNAVSLLLRLSIPPQSDAQRRALANGRIAVIPEPTYGTQLQDLAIQGHRAEGRVHITYTEREVRLAGGEIVRLRKPIVRITDLGYGPLHPRTMISVRVAPPMIGLGLLEAVPDAAILARADPDDSDGDGISGRPNRVRARRSGAMVLGRFGWKALEPDLVAQTAAAFSGDMGLSSALLPATAGGCTAAQKACLAAPHGASKGGAEVPESLFRLVVFYARNLAVPARRNANTPAVKRGRTLFHQVGCAACHTPSFTTGKDTPSPHLADQKIWPYTDLLLHDMGDGLADHRPEARASGREWRTPPLWGIGLTRTVSGHTFFLHDGRARNITEAILWHGGEAQASRDRFAKLSAKERAALLAFVNSL
ncbi:MAG: di-heme oxidoredictase family protein [Pseudomonadota bacterium]